MIKIIEKLVRRPWGRQARNHQRWEEYAAAWNEYHADGSPTAEWGKPLPKK